MSLKQVIDEIVKRIRKTEPERQSEDLENAKNRAGKLNRIEAAHHLRLRRWKNQIDRLYLL